VEIVLKNSLSLPPATRNPEIDGCQLLFHEYKLADNEAMYKISKKMTWMEGG